MAEALLIIDMINTMDFPGGEKLLKNSLPVAKNIQRLKKRFKRKKQPVIYVNDNFGSWRSSWQEVYKECEKEKYIGSPVTKILKPEDDDYFILKPKHSGFYSTNLDVLLKELKVKSLILTGVAGNICVLFTANDAYMRGYEVHVPRNCIASNTKQDNDYVLRQMHEVLSIKISLLH